jgi:hypothetical protein
MHVPLPFTSRKRPAREGDRITWNVNGAVPRDGDNYTFVMRGASKYYLGPQCDRVTSPGFYGYTMYSTARNNKYDYRPYLRVTCSPFAVAGAIRAQPILLSVGANPRVYVANSNALFELNYKDSGTFANAAETYFSLTASGRGGTGLLGVVGGGKFLQNSVTTAMGRTGSQYYVYACDDNAASKPHINKFKVPFNRANGADDLTNVFDLPSNSSRSTHFITWDYFGGSLYFADQGGNSTLYRLRQ